MLSRRTDFSTTTSLSPRSLTRQHFFKHEFSKRTRLLYGCVRKSLTARAHLKKKLFGQLGFSTLFINCAV